MNSWHTFLGSSCRMLLSKWKYKPRKEDSVGYRKMEANNGGKDNPQDKGDQKLQDDSWKQQWESSKRIKGDLGGWKKNDRLSDVILRWVLQFCQGQRSNQLSHPARAYTSLSVLHSVNYIGSLKSVMVWLFTLQKSANSTNQSLIYCCINYQPGVSKLWTSACFCTVQRMVFIFF